MNRRAATWTVRILAVAALVLVAAGVTMLTVPPPVAHAATTAAATVANSPAQRGGDDPPPSTIDEIPPSDTVNAFYPEGQDLTTCISAAPLPGCGSKAQGGWHQTIAFLVMFAGLVLIFGRVIWAAASRRDPSPDDQSTSDRPGLA